jgi:hypothetical protein
MRIRIQYFSNCGSGFRIPDLDPRFDDLKLKKTYSCNLISIFLIKNFNLLIPRPPQRTPKLQEKPSALKREQPELKIMKILDFTYFSGSFLPSWIRIQQLKLMRIHADPDTDPDQKPCFLEV